MTGNSPPLSLLLDKMEDLIEVEAWSYMKQGITRCLIAEAHIRGVSPLSQVVINVVIQSFSALALTNNQCFCTVVVRCTMNAHLSQQHQVSGFPHLSHLESHHIAQSFDSKLEHLLSRIRLGK